MIAWTVLLIVLLALSFWTRVKQYDRAIPPFARWVLVIFLVATALLYWIG